jgi:hypothetical protein
VTKTSSVVPRLLLAFVLFALALAYLIAQADEPSGKKDDLKAYDARIKAADRAHWSFQPVRATAIPQVQETGWVRNPIDQFVAARLEAKQWKPAPTAEPRALLRRMYLDLIGLPPTPEEQ